MRGFITRTSCRSVLKPVRNQIQSSLQSVCDMGTHLCRYPVAGVALAALGTCKQHIPQITVVCDGAVLRGAHKLQITNEPANKPGSTAQLFSFNPVPRIGRYHPNVHQNPVKTL